MKQLTIKANQTTTQQQQTGADHADATATAGQPVTGVVSAFHCQTDPFEQQSKVDLKTYPPNTTESANTYSFPHAVASLSDNYDSYYENQPTPSLQEPVYSVTANNAGNSTNTTKRCVMKVGCCICCTIVVLIVFLGILGAMVGDDDNDDADNDRGEHASPPLSPPPFTIPPSSLPTQTPGDDNNDNDNDASSTVPPTTIMPVLPTGPPVEIRVVNMTVETLIQGDTELVIQYNQLWWEKKDYYYYDGVAVPTIVNCQDLDDAAAATTELSSLCRAGTDLGSRPTLLFAVSIVPDNTNENQWSSTGLQPNIREFPTQKNRYTSRIFLHGLEDPFWSVLKLSFCTVGGSYCSSLDDVASPFSHVDGNNNANANNIVKMTVKALIDSDDLLVLHKYRIQWFHVEGSRPGAIPRMSTIPTRINCVSWEPLWGNLPTWCQRCTWPSVEKDSCDMDIDIGTDTVLRDVTPLESVDRNFTVSWRRGGPFSEEWNILKGGPTPDAWTIRLKHHGVGQAWCSIRLTIEKAGDSFCENRPAQSCAEICGTQLICDETAQNWSFLGDDNMFPGETRYSY